MTTIEPFVPHPDDRDETSLDVGADTTIEDAGDAGDAGDAADDADEPAAEEGPVADREIDTPFRTPELPEHEPEPAGADVAEPDRT